MEQIAIKALGLIDKAKGITPTVNTFTTVPTNLSNTTDGDPDTCATVGAKTNSGAAAVGNFIYDLGEVVDALLVVKAGIWCDSSTCSVKIYTSPDNLTWNYGATIATGNSTTEEIVPSFTMSINHRYVNVRLVSGGANTSNIKLYMVEAYALRN